MSLIRRGVVGRYPQFNNYVAPLSQLYGQTNVTSAAGERIDEWTALGVSAVLGSVSLLADTVAAMPLRQYKLIKGRRVAVPLADILKNPDPESNTFELIHQMVFSCALHGNAYIHIDRNRSGNMIGLVPLHPYQMQVLPTGDQVGRKYLHLGNDINQEDLIHMRWLTPPQSLVGVSPMIQNRNLIGIAMAMDRHISQFYGEGATPQSVLETDQKLTLDQARTIQGTFEATHRRHRRVAVGREVLRLVEGVAKPEIPALDDAVLDYVKERDKRIEHGVKEKTNKKLILALMDKHNIGSYEVDDMVVVRKPKDETASIKVMAAADYTGDPANPTDDGDDD